ncbi:MAG: family metallo-hydrolase [Acidobacteriota bacterium]|nr:family metallo-hydrolase [Acidobacteriota bacterium]
MNGSTNVGHGPLSAPAMSSRWLSPCLFLLLASLAVPPGSGLEAVAPVASPAADEVWITLGADAFATASRLFVAGADGAALARVAEVAGVVLTRVPRAGLPALSARIHDELHRCGGFIAHESRAEAEAALARLAAPPHRAPDGSLPFAIDRPIEVAALAAAIDEAQILATFTALSTSFPNRFHAHLSGTASANWIRDLWAGYAAGRPEVTVELFSHGAITPQPSVILTIPGTTLGDEVVILGAHQDSIQSDCWGNPTCDAPGADDDASGIATLSEVIRVAAAADFTPQRTVQFIAYAAEEVGLEGSDDIAATYLAAGTDVVAVLQQDMTGYNGSVEDMALISDFTHPDLTAFLGALLDAYQPTLLWTLTACGYGCSDHAPWTSRGYRAAFSFESQFGDHNPTIHTPSDTVATLGGSAAHAAKFARLAAAFLVETALDGPGLFSDGFGTGDVARWSSAVSP